MKFYEIFKSCLLILTVVTTSLVFCLLFFQPVNAIALFEMGAYTQGLCESGRTLCNRYVYGGPFYLCTFAGDVAGAYAYAWEVADNMDMEYNEVWCWDDYYEVCYKEYDSYLSYRNCYGGYEPYDTFRVYVPPDYLGKPCNVVIHKDSIYEYRTQGVWDPNSDGCAVCDGIYITQVDRGSSIENVGPYCGYGCSGVSLQCHGYLPGQPPEPWSCAVGNSYMLDVCNDDCSGLEDGFCSVYCGADSEPLPGICTSLETGEGDCTCHDKQPGDVCGYIDHKLANCSNQCQCVPEKVCVDHSGCQVTADWYCCIAKGKCVDCPRTHEPDEEFDNPYLDSTTNPPKCSVHGDTSAWQYRDYTCSAPYGEFDCRVTYDSSITSVIVNEVKGYCQELSDRIKAVPLGRFCPGDPIPGYDPFADVNCDGKVDLRDDYLVNKKHWGDESWCREKLEYPHYPGECGICKCADLSKDGKIDGRDVYYVKRGFGAEPGDPLWNPLADINCDDKIDGRDLFPIQKNFGMDCTIEPTAEPLSLTESIRQFFEMLLGG